MTHLIKNDTNTIQGGGVQELVMILFAILTLSSAIITPSLVQIKKVHAYTTSTTKLLSSIKDVKHINDLKKFSEQIISSEYGAKITKEFTPGVKASLFRTIILNAGKLRQITNIKDITLENVLGVMKITVCTLAIIGKVHPTISLATNTLDMGLFARNALIESLSDDNDNENVLHLFSFKTPFYLFCFILFYFVLFCFILVKFCFLIVLLRLLNKLFSI